MSFYDAIQMIGFGAFNAIFLVLAQQEFGWTKTEYAWHLSIVALFALIGACLGRLNLIATMDATKKLVLCAIFSALALVLVLYFGTFPYTSILFGISDGLVVITSVVTKTKVQLQAVSTYPNSLSSILASRSIIIKAATALGALSCLFINSYLSLEVTLAIYIIPIGLSFLPFVLGQREERLAVIE